MDAKSRKSKAQELWTNVATRLTLKLDKRVTTPYPETAAWDLNKTAFRNTPCEGPGLRTQFAVLEEALDQQAVTHQNAAAPFRPERSKASQETLEPQQEPSIPPWSPSSMVPVNGPYSQWRFWWTNASQLTNQIYPDTSGIFRGLQRSEFTANHGNWNQQHLHPLPGQHLLLGLSKVAPPSASHTRCINLHGLLR